MENSTCYHQERNVSGHFMNHYVREHQRGTETCRMVVGGRGAGNVSWLPEKEILELRTALDQKP
jgi:hypothetical protein